MAAPIEDVLIEVHPSDAEKEVREKEKKGDRGERTEEKGERDKKDRDKEERGDSTKENESNGLSKKKEGRP
uniref:Uncharacterized protein n=1 Tax=Amphimedon queenslandica TaxID=400682 RepID=A0A1X7U1I4_AMPQE